MQPRQRRKGACQEGGQEAQERACKQRNRRQNRVEESTGILMSSEPHADMQEGPDAFEWLKRSPLLQRIAL